MSELVPVDVPPLDAVLLGLQSQDGRLRGRVLELKRGERVQTRQHVRGWTLASPGRGARHPLCQQKTLMPLSLGH